MTTVPTGKPEESPALSAFTEVIRDGTAPRTAIELDQGLESLLARVADDGKQRRGFIRWSLVGATVVLCALVAVRAATNADKRLRAPELSPPTYRIEGGSVLEGGYLREADHAGIKMFFDEGSKLVLLPGARGRLRAVDAAETRVAVEQGTASFQVTHASGRRWLVEVGPFLVTVTGTVFTVDWDPSNERFELRLRRGRVVVSGPMSGSDIALRSGQRLVVNLPKAETVIVDEKPDEGVGEAESAPVAPALTPSATRPPLTHDKPSVPGPTLAPAPTQAAKSERKIEHKWAADLASGHWDRILEDVERGGLAASLERASSEDLLALADAARYRRRTDLARAALMAERRRFPASPRALDAIFLLGRVDEARERGTAQAIAWYDEYLSLSPTGPYAAEALGRKMTLTSELAGPARARPIAEEYLRRFPKGSYAGPARALRRAP